MTAIDKMEWIRNRARRLWESEGLAPDMEQECWDKAVEEFEAGTAEGEPDPARLGPLTGPDDGAPKKP